MKGQLTIITNAKISSGQRPSLRYVQRYPQKPRQAEKAKGPLFAAFGARDGVVCYWTAAGLALVLLVVWAVGCTPSGTTDSLPIPPQLLPGGVSDPASEESLESESADQTVKDETSSSQGSKTGPPLVPNEWPAESRSAAQSVRAVEAGSRMLSPHPTEPVTKNSTPGNAQPTPAGQPNLVPALIQGWSDAIVVSTRVGTNIDDNPLPADTPLYVDWVGMNNGSAGVGRAFCCCLYIDDVYKDRWTVQADIADPGEGFCLQDCNIGRLSPGYHTIQIVLDYGNVISESNEFDNSYTKTITVGQPAGGSWLILYYMCNGGNLEGSCEVKFQEIAQSSGNGSFVAYVLWDHLNGEDRVFRMKNSTNWTSGYTHNVDYWNALDIGLGSAEMDTGDVATLNKFTDFVFGRETADHYDHYLLVIVNHGGGVYPKSLNGVQEQGPVITGIAFDGSNQSSYLSTQELGQGCAHLSEKIGRKVDVIYLDACLMQMIEVNHELRDSCDFLVASENEGWTRLTGTGWERNYLSSITSSTTAATLANTIAIEYDAAFSSRGKTISVLKQAQTGNVSSAVSNLGSALIANMRTVRAPLQMARIHAQKLAYPDTHNTVTQSNFFLDLKNLCQEINEHVSGVAQVNNAASAVISAIGSPSGSFLAFEKHQSGVSYDYVTGETYDFEVSRVAGVSIFFPESTLVSGDTYRNYVNTSPDPSNLAFCASTQWDEFLRAYLEFKVLKVTSSGASNVAVTCSTDRLNQGNGTTTFTRLYGQTDNVTLTAPATIGGWIFAQWKRNGAALASGQSVTFRMDVDYDLEAVYVQAPPVTMSVSSTPTTGVPITVGTTDVNGQRNGNTNFSRLYVPNTNVTLTAPQTFNGRPFAYWKKDGAVVSVSCSISTQVTRNCTLEAGYGAAGTVTLMVSSNLRLLSLPPINIFPRQPPVITIAPADLSGQTGGNPPLVRTYNRNTTVYLTASSTVSGRTFDKWQVDGVDSGSPGYRNIAVPMNANHTVKAVYR